MTTHVLRENVLTKNGYDVHYYVAGPPDGELIVFLHPAFADHHTFEKQVEFFAERYRVLAPDMVGHGRSQVRSGRVTIDETLEEVCGAVVAVAAEDGGIAAPCAEAFGDPHGRDGLEWSESPSSPATAIRDGPSGRPEIQVLANERRRSIGRWTAEARDRTAAVAILTSVNTDVMLSMEFEWDSEKEAANLVKHGISFAAAARVLESGTTFEFQSDRSGEPRWVAIGTHPVTKKVVAVVYTMRGGRYRIISARKARENEEKDYQEHIGRGTREGR
jgi:uncharacterized DUF497 family protein